VSNEKVANTLLYVVSGWWGGIGRWPGVSATSKCYAARIRNKSYVDAVLRTANHPAIHPPRTLLIRRVIVPQSDKDRGRKTKDGHGTLGGAIGGGGRIWQDTKDDALAMHIMAGCVS